MQKHILLTLTAVLTLGTAAFAQDGAKPATKVKIDDLSAPTSPAFVLLGIAPAAVERPETPKAFTLNLLETVAKSNGVPRNYALEVAPYWLVSHPNLEFETYQNPGVGQSILQTLAISIGTSPIPGETAEADPLGTKIGLGIRTAIFNGQVNSRFRTQLQNRIAKIEPLADVVLDLLIEEDELLDTVRANAGDQAASSRLIAVQNGISEARQRLEALALEVQSLDAERVGFFLNVAGGQVWTAFADDVRNSKAEKRGFWVTPSYRWRGCGDADTCEASLDAIGVVRVLKEPENNAAWDYGGRVVWKATKELNLSLEAVRRHQQARTADVEEDSNRTVGLVEYRIRQDLILFGSFGQDFKELTGKKPLVSFLGLNIGFGDKPVVSASPKAATP